MRLLAPFVLFLALVAIQAADNKKKETEEEKRARVEAAIKNVKLNEFSKEARDLGSKVQQLFNQAKGDHKAALEQVKKLMAAEKAKELKKLQTKEEKDKKKTKDAKKPEKKNKTVDEKKKDKKKDTKKASPATKSV